MEPDNEEKELRRIFGNYRLKKVPEPILKDYVSEVRKKIDSPAGPAFPVGLLAGVGMAALILAGAVLLRMGQPQPAPEVPAPAAVAVMESATVERPKETAPETRERQRFLLSMLGEDEGLLTDAVRFEPDADFLGPALA